MQKKIIASFFCCLMLLTIIHPVTVEAKRNETMSPGLVYSGSQAKNIPIWSTEYDTWKIVPTKTGGVAVYINNRDPNSVTNPNQDNGFGLYFGISGVTAIKPPPRPVDYILDGVGFCSSNGVALVCKKGEPVYIYIQARTYTMPTTNYTIQFHYDDIPAGLNPW